MKLVCVVLALLPSLVFATLSDELNVYDYYIIHENNEPKTGFVVLSDGFPYGDFKEKNIIAPENLGQFEYTNDNYHELKGEYRKRFFKGIGIVETDSLFVNNLNRNKVFKFSVKHLKLTAFLTPYGPNSPIENWDYLVGFELDSNLLSFKTPESYNQTIFSCVAKENPFNEGKAKVMKWEKIDSTDFKWELTDEVKPKYLLTPNFKDAYKFAWGKINFYVREGYSNNYLTFYHLVIVDAISGKEITSSLFFDSEGTYLQPLNGQTNSFADLQFTGYIFKYKPPVIYGFQSNSFGCPYISFANKNEAPIWLRCDNRH